MNDVYGGVYGDAYGLVYFGFVVTTSGVLLLTYGSNYLLLTLI